MSENFSFVRDCLNYFMEKLEIYSGLCYTNEHGRHCTRELGNLAQTMPANAVESDSTERK